MSKKEPLSYKSAGVDIDKADGFITTIGPLARSTFRPEVMTDIGSFGALFKLDLTRYREPVLVSGTDGVGTKLKIAFLAGRHDTVGVDLVAMCVNDILTLGAEPLFFLDYFALSRLDPAVGKEVIAGIAKGCIEAGCSLIGGETAEMPGFYQEGEYDLSGFAVGVVDRQAIVNGSAIKEGDSLIGIASSGLHSNGYSLVRKLFFEIKGMDVHTFVPELKKTLAQELLTPTRIYVKAMQALQGILPVKGMAHITGGGITDNLPRMLPEGLGALLQRQAWQVPEIFVLIQSLGSVEAAEMLRTFNMGIGFVLAVEERYASIAVDTLGRAGYPAQVIGTVAAGKGVVYR